MTQPNLELFRRLLMQQGQTARSPVPMIDEGPATATSSELTPLQRFAGGALYSTYTPYQGDQKKYGYNPQHRFYPTPTQYPTTGTVTSTATSTRDDGNYQQQNGGPDSGASASSFGVDRSHHGKSFDEMNPAELQAYAGSKERNSVMGMSLPSIIAGAIGMKGANFLEDSQLSAAMNAAGLGAMNPGDYVDGKVAGGATTSLGLSPELAGRNDQTGAMAEANAATAAAAEANNDPNTARRGRIVTRANVRPGGKEDGSIQVTVGEGIVRKESMKKIGARNFKALNAGKFDRVLLDAAVDAALARK